MKTASYVTWQIGALCLALGAALLIGQSLEASGSMVALVALSIFSIIVITNFGKETNRTENRRVIPYLSFPLFLFVFWLAISKIFGYFDVEAMLFHIRHGVDTKEGIPRDILPLIYLFCIAIILTIFGMRTLVARNRLAARLDSFAVIPLIFLNPFSISAASSFGIIPVESIELSQEYISPAEAQLQVKSPPNIVHIFLESAERTLNDTALFGEIMNPVNAFAQEGLEFTNIQQAAQTNWTIAGIVAAQCGVPLIQPWLTTRNERSDGSEYLGEMGAGNFMPNAECLSDLLFKQGYKNSFFKGASLDFAGMRDFLQSHNYQNQFGLKELFVEGKTSTSDWGIDDEHLFDAAFDQIMRNKAANEKFNVGLVTLGGHGLDGYVSKSCRSGQIKLTNTNTGQESGVECANLLAARFVERLRAAGVLEDTVVIIQSDHLMMKTTISHKLVDQKRRNFFVAFGPHISKLENDKSATMFDVYPTILEMAGYHLPDGKAALGVSMLSEHKSLLETHGMKKLDNSIRLDKNLRDFLWGVTSHDQFLKQKISDQIAGLNTAAH